MPRRNRNPAKRGMHRKGKSKGRDPKTAPLTPLVGHPRKKTGER